MARPNTNVYNGTGAFGMPKRFTTLDQHMSWPGVSSFNEEVGHVPILKPCLDCGTPSAGTRCKSCADTHRRATRNDYQRRARANGRIPSSSTQQGYDSKWRRLSEQARRLQPFCVDCGATEDLQADHSPEAWRRRDKGLPLRLKDIDVVCRACNVARGAARGDNVTR